MKSGCGSLRPPPQPVKTHSFYLHHHYHNHHHHHHHHPVNILPVRNAFLFSLILHSFTPSSPLVVQLPPTPHTHTHIHKHTHLIHSLIFKFSLLFLTLQFLPCLPFLPLPFPFLPFPHLLSAEGLAGTKTQKDEAKRENLTSLSKSR